MSAEPAASRKLAGHTQDQAAAVLCVARRTLQDWEGGKTQMPFMLLKLYRHLAGIERIPFKKLQHKPLA